jgi:hypothetical protein
MKREKRTDDWITGSYLVNHAAVAEVVADVAVISPAALPLSFFWVYA